MINTNKIWVSDEDAKHILVKVLRKKVPEGIDYLWTLKAALDKILKHGTEREKTKLYIMLEAPIEKVLEYLSEDTYNEAVLWRMNNDKISADQSIREQELKRVQDTKKYRRWEGKTTLFFLFSRLSSSTPGTLNPYLSLSS